MKPRKQHAYEVALRMAQVKELRAQVALAIAVDKEADAKKQVEIVEAARRSVLEASHARAMDGQKMDLARYELLTRLDSALAQRLQLAGASLDQAVQQRAEKASENVMAKRHRESVGEHLDDLRMALLHVKAAKAQEDGIELWLENREEGA
jgi:uncharacterized protein YicC (UPF0701 family)